MAFQKLNMEAVALDFFILINHICKSHLSSYGGVHFPACHKKCCREVHQSGEPSIVGVDYAISMPTYFSFAASKVCERLFS